MARKEFTPVFEEDESVILERMVERIPDDWRKEPGDFIHDAVAPSPAEVKQLQIQQDEVLRHAFTQYAEGEYLDRKLEEVGLSRAQATPNRRVLNVEADAGVTIPKGHLFTTVVLDSEGNPLEYEVDTEVIYTSATSLDVNLTCKTAGNIGNIATGSEFTLQPSIPGVRTITDAGTTVLGTDTESDESAWERYDFKLKNPDTGGNKNDYLRWAGEVQGVGKSKVIPKWNGNGTVKVIIVDTNYEVPTTILVDEVQDYLDPASTGLGDGKAPCGAKVTVSPATDLIVDITATVTLESGADSAAVKADFSQRVKDYFKTLVFTDTAVVYNKIGAILVNTPKVENYSGLTVNGGTVDVGLAPAEIATLGTVTI